MVAQSTKDRVAALLTEARSKRDSGQLQDAFRALKEASYLDPDNADVKKALESINNADQEDRFMPHLESYLASKTDEAGTQALRSLNLEPIQPTVAVTALDLLLEQTSDAEIMDQLTSTLLSRSADARKELGSRLESQTAILFDKSLTRGPETFRGVTGLAFDTFAWRSTSDQDRYQRELFKLYIRRLITTTTPNLKDRILRAITKQLTLASPNVKDLIDGDVFRTVLSHLDLRLIWDIRAQATLATSKILEVLGDKGEVLLAQFIASMVARQTCDDLIVAFSAAAAVFPIVPATAAKLFLTDGFVQELIPGLERSAKVEENDSTALEEAVLELLSAACVDKACREAIHKSCAAWLRQLTTERHDSHRTLAALILAKIDSSSQDELTAQLTGIVLSDDDEGIRAIEGLVYTTLQPKIKEQVASNPDLLKRLISALSKKDSPAFGPLTIFSNLTTYRPPRTEEQKKIAQLKAYADSSKPEAEDPLDDDKHVTARAKKLLDVDLVPALVAYSKETGSPAYIALIIRILLAMSKEQKHRPKMAQQGAIRALLALRLRATKMDKSASEITTVVTHAAHALARLLISVNPSHVFSSGMPATSAVSAIIPLLRLDQQDTEQQQQQRDLLPTFEALLALTNLASMEDSSARDLQIRQAFDTIEDLLFSSNTLIQRASVELVCNLMLSPSGVAKFADGSKDASRRMMILLALADVDDMATRRAAGGALAMLTEWDAAATAVLEKERGVRMLLAMCEDENDEIKHRGLVCLSNLVNMPGELGAKGIAELKKAGGGEKVKDALKSTRDPNVLAVGVEVLKKIME